MSDKMVLMIAAVRRHALEHYEEDGWDYVVECWSDEEIVEEILLCKSDDEAIQKIGSVVKMVDSVRKDVQAEIF